MNKFSRRICSIVAVILMIGIAPVKVQAMEGVNSSIPSKESTFTVNDKVEQEPNDYMNTATKITLNGSYAAKMNTDNDMDYFKFTLNEGKEINIKFSNEKLNNGNDVNWYVTLCNEYLHEIDQLSITGKDTSKTLKKQLKKGTYYIKVFSGNSSASLNKTYYLGVFETSDWMNHWGKDAISEAMEKGWVDQTTKFRPNDNITRAEFVKVVNKAFGYKDSMEINYTDVSKDLWFYNEVAIAAKAGYITTANSKFRPNDPISREEAAAIVTSIMNNKDDNFDKLNKYTDKYKVSPWAKTSVEGAIEAGYMGSGSLQFRPLDKITRAEAVAILSRIK